MAVVKFRPVIVPKTKKKMNVLLWMSVAMNIVLFLLLVVK